MQKLSLAIKCLMLVALMLQAACERKPDDNAQSLAITPLGLTAEELIIREPVAGRDITVAYLTIRNQGNAERLLLGAISPYAKRIEIHEHQHNEGRMRMVRRSSLPIAASADTLLESGGAHLMLFELQTLKTSDEASNGQPPAQSVELTLQFDQGETLTLQTSLSSVLD